MASTTSTSAPKGNSFGQTLHFITSVKLQELDKQRLAHQNHAKVIEQAAAIAGADPIKRVEILSKVVKKWRGSGALQKGSRIVGGQLNLDEIDFWLQQAKKDPSFNVANAQRWVKILEDHINHTARRFDSAKLFGELFNEWLASGDSSAVSYHSVDDTASEAGTSSSEFVDVGRKEMHEQKEKLVSIVFEDHPVDAGQLKAYLEQLFSPEEADTSLDRLRKELKDFGRGLSSRTLHSYEVANTIRGLLATGLMDEEKRDTLKAFLENNNVLTELASVLNMRLAAIDTWTWPAEGIPVDMRRHLNGKYRAFTDPEIVDGLLLHLIGVEWQVKLKGALRRFFDSKAWERPAPPVHKVKERLTAQLNGIDDSTSIASKRNNERRNKFFLSQLQESTAVHTSYDDLVDAPADVQEGSPAQIKQRLLHLITTDIHLNKALYGTHAVLRSDLEWFGPSLPHTSIVTILEFLGMPPRWLSFFKAFLAAPIRFPGETQSRVRRRGTPISYSMSVVCGEAILFIMDFAVNQKGKGLHLYRMHDDLWLWDADSRKVAAAWGEMQTFAGLVGLKFNDKKTGSAVIGEVPEGVELPKGDIRWGFLKLDEAESRFVIDEKDVDIHIMELRRQLASTKSVFGWINAYNKYIAFIVRNFGGIPAFCMGQKHLVEMVDTLARIQKEIFPAGEGTDGALGYVRKVVKERFGMSGFPEGYFYLPISSGGLELENAMLDLLMLEKNGKPYVTYNFVTGKRGDRQEQEQDEEDEDDDGSQEEGGAADSDSARSDASEDSVIDYSIVPWTKVSAEELFNRRIDNDGNAHKLLKEVWDLDSHKRRSKNHRLTDKEDEFMSYEEYTGLRETWLRIWGETYDAMLAPVRPLTVEKTPRLTAALEETKSDEAEDFWNDLSGYRRWVLSMYGEDVVEQFGGLEVVDPNLIPVGMVELFKTSRMKLDQ